MVQEDQLDALIIINKVFNFIIAYHHCKPLLSCLVVLNALNRCDVSRRFTECIY